MEGILQNIDTTTLIEMLHQYPCPDTTETHKISSLENRISEILIKKFSEKSDLQLLGNLSKQYKEKLLNSNEPPAPSKVPKYFSLPTTFSSIIRKWLYNPDQASALLKSIIDLIEKQRCILFDKFNIPSCDPKILFNLEEINKLAQTDIDGFTKKLEFLKAYIEADCISRQDFLILITKIFHMKDDSNQSIMENEAIINAFFPLFLEDLASPDLLKFLFTKNNHHKAPIELINEKLLKESQKYRLANLCKMGIEYRLIQEDIEDQVPFLKNQTLKKSRRENVNYEFRNLTDVSSEEEYKRIADQIELHEMELWEFERFPEKLLKLSKHLRYLNFWAFKDITLAQKIIKNCSHLYTLALQFNDEILIGIQTLDLCQTLNCTHSLKLKTLPNLPVCQELDCKWCENLITLPDLDACQTLDCEGCTQLKTLPPLNNCDKLTCKKCISVTELPVLNNCLELDCTKCAALETIPALNRCQKLFCKGCTKLTHLPPLKMCRILYIVDCAKLKIKPEVSPTCKVIDSP